MYIFASEVFGDQMRKIFIVVSFNFYVSGGIFVHLFSMHWNRFSYYIWISLVSIAVLSLPYFFFVESPFYYFKQGNMPGFKRCLAKIVSWNYSKDKRQSALDGIAQRLEHLSEPCLTFSVSSKREPLLDAKTKMGNTQMDDTDLQLEKT